METGKKTSNLDLMLKNEQEKLEKLEKKREKLDNDIKKVRANVEKYTLLRNNGQFNTLANALDGKGIDMNDILTAIQSGDFLSLQEKLKQEN